MPVAPATEAPDTLALSLREAIDMARVRSVDAADGKLGHTLLGAEPERPQEAEEHRHKQEQDACHHIALRSVRTQVYCMPAGIIIRPVSQDEAPWEIAVKVRPGRGEAFMESLRASDLEAGNVYLAGFQLNPC